MPHALLLSPDDQAVNAITGVLEEMSVTCERPLDGLSAAQKLNSQTFDLVLVDCENLPAAKLIFDVCRRGKNGHNPVPIAIVDGRAGLPTAFRLGAELILTKPVAKDQARTTIRTAVGRVRKDVPANESATAQPGSSAAPGAMIEDHTKAAAAVAVSSQLTNFGDPAPSFTPSITPAKASAAVAPTQPHSAMTEVNGAAFPKPNSRSVIPPVSSAGVSESSLFSEPSESVLAGSKPNLPLSDDPVLAELERAELEESAPATASKPDSSVDKTVPGETAARADAHAPVFSSYQQGRQKPRGALVALLALAIAASGFYGAWMYQPGFRTLAQPQIDRALALVGMALPPTQAPHPTRPAAQPTPNPTPVATTTTPSLDAATPPSAASDSVANSTTSSPSGVPTTTPVASAPAQPSASPAAPPASLPIATPTQVVSKSVAIKPAEVKKEVKKVDVAVSSPDAPLPGENTAIILSSKGAEKRLAHSVSPKYPADVRSKGAEGTVVLKEIVDENGKVEGVRLVEGNAVLATAAMQAVKQWRYRPYVRDGKAQPFQTVVIVDFQRP